MIWKERETSQLTHCQTDIQSQLEALITKNYYLNKSAKDGYRSYLQSYASHSLRSVFDVHKLDLVKVAKSFGFSTPPRIDISLGASMGRQGGLTSPSGFK
jgi:ATP-dependent RNA helicase DDX18/HAS1